MSFLLPVQHGTVLQVDLLMTNTSSMRCNRAQCFLQRMVPLCSQYYTNTQNILSPKTARYNTTDAFWGNAKGRHLLVCVPKLLVTVPPKAKLSCVQLLQKWLVTTVSSLDHKGQ